MWKLQALTRLRILRKIAESVFRDTTFTPQVMKYGTKISGAVEGVFHQSRSYCTLLKLGNTTWMEGKLLVQFLSIFEKLLTLSVRKFCQLQNAVLWNER